MNSKIKNLLKTTAAVATLLAGSQTWGATITGEDGTNYGTSGRDMKGLVSMNNTGAIASTANFTTAAGTVLYYTQGFLGVSPTGNWTFGKGTKIHLTLTAALTMGSTFTSPKGDSIIFVDGGASALTLGVDQSQFALKVLSDVTVDLPATGALSLPIEIAKGKTLTTAATNITSITGKISGEGNLTLNAATGAVSDLSGLKGTLTTAAATAFKSSLASFQGTLKLGVDQDLSLIAKNLTQTLPKNVNIDSYNLTVPGGTIKKVTSANGTVIAKGPLVIEKLDVSGGAVTLDGNITVKKVTGGNNISLAANANVVIHGLKNYGGDIATTGAGSKISFQ